MEQTDLLRVAVHELERQQIPYMVVGSLASGAYGEPRMTRDIAGIIQLRSVEIDTAYIEEWGAQLGLGAAWQAVLTRIAAK